MKNYVAISDFQVTTLKLLDNLIENNKTFSQIWDFLANKGYTFRGVRTNSGRWSKNHFDLCGYDKQRKAHGYSFVTLVRTLNGKATYETIGLC